MSRLTIIEPYYKQMISGAERLGIKMIELNIQFDKALLYGKIVKKIFTATERYETYESARIAIRWNFRIIEIAYEGSEYTEADLKSIEVLEKAIEEARQKDWKGEKRLTWMYMNYIMANLRIINKYHKMVKNEIGVLLRIRDTEYISNMIQGA